MKHPESKTSGAAGSAEPVTVSSPPPNIAALPAPVSDPLTALNEALAENAGLRERVRLAEGGRDKLQEHLKKLEANPFSFVVGNHDAGDLLAELGSKLTELCAAVRKHDEKGDLVLKLRVKPFKHTAVIFNPEVKLSAPRAPVPPAVFYASKEGELTRNDPRQGTLGFEEEED